MTPTRNRSDLSLLKGCVFLYDARVGKDKIPALLASQPDNTCFPCNVSHLDALFKKLGASCTSVSIFKMTEADFKVSFDVSKFQTLLDAKYRLYRSHTELYAMYPNVQARKGDILHLGRHRTLACDSLAVITDKNDDKYLDFTGYPVLERPDGTYEIDPAATYCNKDATGMKHTGDILPGLLQGISVHSNPGSSIVFCLTGFTRTALPYFKDRHNPAAIAVDHDNQLVYTLPIDVSAAATNGGTLVAFAAAHVNDDGQLKLVMLRSPPCVKDVNTGDRGPAVQAALIVAHREMKQILAQHNALNELEVAAAISAALAPTVLAPAAPARDTLFKIGQQVRLKGLVSVDGIALNGCIGCITEISRVDAPWQVRYRINVAERVVVIRENNLDLVAGKCVAFVQQGTPVTDYANCADSICFLTGKGLQGFASPSEFMDAHASSLEVLNLAYLGPVSGTLVATGRLPKFNGKLADLDWLSDALEAAPLVTACVSPSGWEGNTSQKPTTLGNFLWIVFPPDVGDVMASLKGFPITCLFQAGPNSIVLAFYRGELYWLSGVRWTHLVDEIPAFGERVTPLFRRPRIEMWVALGGCTNLAFPRLVQTKDKTLYSKGAAVLAANYHMDPDDVDGTKDVMTQACKLFTAAELKAFSARLIRELAALVEASNSLLAAERRKLALEMVDGEAVAPRRKKMEQLTAAMRQNTKKWAPVTDMLANMGSTVGSTATIGGNLVQLARATAIASNVNGVAQMDANAFAEFLAATESYAILTMHPAMEAPLRSLTTRETLQNFLRVRGATLGRDSRCFELDGDTVAALCENPAIHAFKSVKGGKSVFFPSRDGTSNVAIPCFPDFDVPNIRDLKFIELANQPAIAQYRISLRGALSSTKWVALAPDDSVLSAFIPWFFFGAGRAIAGDSPPGAFGDTRTTQVRAAFCNGLCAAVVGATPLTDAYNLFSRSPSCFKPDFYFIIVDAMDLFAQAGFGPVLRYAKWNLIAYVRALVTDPLTTPLRSAAKAIDAVTAEASLETRERELFVTAVMVKLVLLIGKNRPVPAETLKEIAGRALELLSTVGSVTGFRGRRQGGLRRMYTHFLILSRGGKEGKMAPSVDILLDIAANIEIKRSGCFRGAKEALLAGNKEDAECMRAEAVAPFHALLTARHESATPSFRSMQNHAVFEACLAAVAEGAKSHECIAQLRGDAELKRAAYSVLGKPVSEERVKSEAIALYKGGGTSDPLASTKFVAETSNSAVVDALIVHKLRAPKAYALAVLLASKTPKFDEVFVSMPECTEALMRCLMSHSECDMAGVAGIVNRFLLGWRDPNAVAQSLADAI